MSVTRASIDRKLDALTVRAEAAKQDVGRKLVAAAAILTGAWLTARWRRHRAQAAARRRVRPVR
jgi:hypothetical protein